MGGMSFQEPHASSGHRTTGRRDVPVLGEGSLQGQTGLRSAWPFSTFLLRTLLVIIRTLSGTLESAGFYFYVLIYFFVSYQGFDCLRDSHVNICLLPGRSWGSLCWAHTVSLLECCWPAQLTIPSSYSPSCGLNPFQKRLLGQEASYDSPVPPSNHHLCLLTTSFPARPLPLAQTHSSAWQKEPCFHGSLIKSASCSVWVWSRLPEVFLAHAVV